MNWHKRYLQQARWTSNLRAYLFEQAGLKDAATILEVGCGTGAILVDLVTHAHPVGLDIDQNALSQCRQNSPAASLIRGDALDLPFPNGLFDIVYCHYLLLWIANPVQALMEMKRVARKGGYVLAMAEPDHTARLDLPPELARLGRWQTEALARQGAHPGFGAQLAFSFDQAGIPIFEAGRIQGSIQPKDKPVSLPVQDTGLVAGQPSLTLADWNLEWDVLETDLSGQIDPQEIQRMKILDKQAWQRGERRLDVPTYFAMGRN